MNGALIGIATLLVTGIVGAAPLSQGQVEDAARSVPVRIEWAGSVACRPTTEIVEGLRRLIGSESSPSPNLALEVDAVVESIEGGWTLALSATGRHGALHRNLVAPNCSELAQAASLVLSLWVQSTDIVDGSTPRPSPIPVQSAVSAPSNDQARIAEASPRSFVRQSRLSLRRQSWDTRPGRRLRLQFAIGATVFSGALPETGLGISGRVGVSLDSWRLEALGLWLESQRVWAGSRPTLGGEFSLLASGLLASRVIPIFHALNALPGIWAIAGQLKGASLGDVVQSTPSRDGWGGAGVALDTEIRVRRLRIILGGGGGLPFGRPRFIVGEALLYQTPPVTWFAHLQAGTAFP